jgi:hypothetical protein
MTGVIRQSPGQSRGDQGDRRGVGGVGAIHRTTCNCWSLRRHTAVTQWRGWEPIVLARLRLLRAQQVIGPVQRCSGAAALGVLLALRPASGVKHQRVIVRSIFIRFYGARELAWFCTWQQRARACEMDADHRGAAAYSCLGGRAWPRKSRPLVDVERIRAKTPRLQDSKTPESVRGTTCDVLASGPSVTTSRASGCSGYSKTEEGTSMLKKSWRDGKKGLAEDVEAPPRLIVWGRDARELNPNKVSATVSPLVNSRSRPPVLSSKVSEHPSGWRRIQNELGP